MNESNNIRLNRRLSNEDFLIRLKEQGVEIIPLDKYTRMFDNIRWQCDKYNNHIWYATPANVLKKNGTRCPYCSGNKVLKGFNDLWTTHPEVACLLNDKSLGYKLMANSHKKVDFVCPRCNTDIKHKVLRDVVKYNSLACPLCSDGISYPEKFMANVLNQLNVEFVYNKSLKWSDNKRYDFYVEKISLIIETHGAQHYSDRNGWGNDIENEVYNDNYKMELAKSNGILHYVTIDCSKSDKDFIKDSIITSDISLLFDLSKVDWEKCDDMSMKSNVVEAYELWNSGIRSTKDISEILNLSRTTIINYLNKAAKLGKCDYSGKEQMAISASHNRPIINNNIAV